MAGDFKEVDMSGMSNATAGRRGRMAIRIALIALAIALVGVAALAAVNLHAATVFNQATASLNANIDMARRDDADAETLNIRQQQTDKQFAQAGSARMLLLPQVRKAIDANSAVSAALTRITVKRVEKLHAGQSSGNTANAQQDNTASNGETGSGLTEEQRQQVEELMKANQQSAAPQQSTGDAESTTTEHNGTGTAKPW